MLESMLQGGFLFKNSTATWEFLEELEKKKKYSGKPLEMTKFYNCQCQGGMFVVSDLSHLESRFTALKNQLKGLTIQPPRLFKVLL